jgi:hypothetical protein
MYVMKLAILPVSVPRMRKEFIPMAAVVDFAAQPDILPETATR